MQYYHCQNKRQNKISLLYRLIIAIFTIIASNPSWAMMDISNANVSVNGNGIIIDHSTGKQFLNPTRTQGCDVRELNMPCTTIGGAVPIDLEPDVNNPNNKWRLATAVEVGGMFKNWSSAGSIFSQFPLLIQAEYVPDMQVFNDFPTALDAFYQQLQSSLPMCNVFTNAIEFTVSQLARTAVHTKSGGTGLMGPLHIHHIGYLADTAISGENIFHYTYMFTDYMSADLKDFILILPWENFDHPGDINRAYFDIRIGFWLVRE